jgi:hypothetical protein
LKGSVVKSLDQDTMVVSYSEGITKISTTDLPQELQDRYRFDIRIAKEEAPLTPMTMPVPVSDSAPAKKSVSTHRTHQPAGNPRIEGDPGLWKEVTRTSLGRVFIPGKGWLSVGTKGPIPTSGFEER